MAELAVKIEVFGRIGIADKARDETVFFKYGGKGKHPVVIDVHIFFDFGKYRCIPVTFRSGIKKELWSMEIYKKCAEIIGIM